ncbi:MAG TPA: hypothetical protein VFG54_12330 [Prolixibacteraceae bacterium]|nr:hypothetical protein [Prolixibacteraceae bacterium]
MPRLDKLFVLEVTPEQFLRNCSREELIEIDLLLQSPHIQMRMKGSYSHEAKQDQNKPIKIEKE